jgi:hypothetical protein
VNERWTVVLAVVCAEAGGSIALLIGSPQRVRAAGFTSFLEILVPSAGAVLLFCAVMAGVSWVMVPKLWRFRQELSTKLRLLGWVCAVWLLLDNVATVYFYPGSATLDGFGDSMVHSLGALIVAMALKSGAGLFCFWLAVWCHIEVDRRKVVGVTPPPKFGRE